ncbi:MAG: nucleoside monophosphate kinase [Legionellales bacterium]
MKIILLAGAPGSGKSTQGTALMNMNAQIKHLSLGDVVRKNPKHPITCKYQELINSGGLLPDDVIFEILNGELTKLKDQDIVLLLDGYPRTDAQYKQFKDAWGLPDGLIHLDVDLDSLHERLHYRDSSRGDDNENAIAKRLDFYGTTTKPLLGKIKDELKKKAITGKGETIQATSHYLYAQLQRIPSVHKVLSSKMEEEPAPYPLNSPVKPVWAYSVFSQLWQTGSEYFAIDAVQKGYKTTNFSFSMLGKKIVYLETMPEVQAVLRVRSDLGPVYRHFSIAAGLKYDFVATSSHNANSYHLPNKQVNIWRVIHEALLLSLRADDVRIKQLMDKHLDQTFFAEKTFDLDSTFDNFFCGFWSEYLFGNKVSADSYMETREQLLAAMRQCFYTNNYKGLDPSGLSSYLYSHGVRGQINLAKDKIKQFMHKSMPDSLLERFRAAINTINTSRNLELSKKIIDEILADNLFDLIFEPDFLENVLYEAVAAAVKENADLHVLKERNYVYAQGMKQGFLYPIRSRVLEEAVTLTDGTAIPAGSVVYLNLKKAGLYHSTGARRCVGQAYTHCFKEHLFDRLASVEFKVKGVSYPEARVGSDNVPMSPERYQVSWRLKRDEAMRYLPAHDYKGTNFFDVLSLHQHTGLNAQMVRQCVLKIKRFMQKNKVNLGDVVIVTPEVRGLPIASQVAYELKLSLYVIRKQGGYKMAKHEVYTESYDKGYGDPDAVELPIAKVKEMAGKQIVFIDDGIASGKSAMACIHLLENHYEPGEKAARVPMILTLLKHDYTPIDPKLSEHRLVKTLFDCNSSQNKIALPLEHARPVNA